jgi:subtilisin family serine protease
VHDVAPGAKLLFSGPSTSLDMVDAVQCLADAGANVIVDDLGFFGEPYFEDGPVADAVSAAVTAGVSYHSSAGNEAREHIEEDFFPAPGSNGQIHDWAAGANDRFNGVVVPAGGTLTCILQWNDPFGAAADDYDLALFDANLNLVTQSVDPQVGAQDPIEIVQVVNQTNTDQLANILVERFSGQPRRLELFCLGASAMEHGSAAGSIFGHAALPSVVAVGAVDVHDPGLDTVEAFSSHGPSRIDFPTPELRAKPDLVAFDGVAISNAGGFPLCPPFCAFFGTSAAAPHSAGVAALLLDQDPTLTPAEIQAALTAGAVDIGAPGFDEASGFGRLDAVAAASTLTVSTTTSTTTSTTRPTTTSTSSTTSSSTSTSSSTTTTRAPTTTTTSSTTTHRAPDLDDEAARRPTQTLDEQPPPPVDQTSTMLHGRARPTTDHRTSFLDHTTTPRSDDHDELDHHLLRRLDPTKLVVANTPPSISRSITTLSRGIVKRRDLAKRFASLTLHIHRLVQSRRTIHARYPLERPGPTSVIAGRPLTRTGAGLLRVYRSRLRHIQRGGGSPFT